MHRITVVEVEQIAFLIAQKRFSFDEFLELEKVEWKITVSPETGDS